MAAGRVIPRTVYGYCSFCTTSRFHEHVEGGGTVCTHCGITNSYRPERPNVRFVAKVGRRAPRRG